MLGQQNPLYLPIPGRRRVLLLETAQAQSCSVSREGTVCCHCSCLEEQELLALLSPWLGQAVCSGQEAASPTAPPASCAPPAAVLPALARPNAGFTQEGHC